MNYFRITRVLISGVITLWRFFVLFLLGNKWGCLPWCSSVCPRPTNWLFCHLHRSQALDQTCVPGQDNWRWHHVPQIPLKWSNKKHSREKSCFVSTTIFFLQRQRKCCSLVLKGLFKCCCAFILMGKFLLWNGPWIIWNKTEIPDQKKLTFYCRNFKDFRCS